MAIAVEPDEKVRQREPDAGVVRDARSRQTRRRAGIAGVVLVAGVAAALFTFVPGSSPTRSGSHRNLRAALRRSDPRGGGLAPRLAPILAGGERGWCLIASGGGSCPNLPIGPATTVSDGGTELPGVEPITLLVEPRVSDVLVDGHKGRLALLGALPYGLRLVRITFRRGSGVIFYAKSLRAIDARGRPIGPSVPVWGAGGSEPDPRIRWWQRPRSAPRGPCGIHARGLSGLTPEWGHVATVIRGSTGTIVGRAFLSCIDTELYLHRWPLDAAILLDAQHPGRPPAPIPGMRPVPRARGVFEAPGDWNGPLAAVRRGNAWLVVAGGSGRAQRLDVLRHLSASVVL